jgi:hypothetical protein
LKGKTAWNEIKPKYRKEILETLEQMAIWNGDVSNATENVVKLANRPHLVHFAEGTSEAVIKKAQEYLSEVEGNLYRGGMWALKNDLLTQLALFGAISAESSIRKDLKGVKRVHLVAHKHITFRRNEKEDDYEPYQNIAQVGISEPVKLNQFTYKYLSLGRINENPYGIPPFLAALRDIDIDDYLVDNLRYVAKKHGVMGFLSVLVNAPAKKQGESDTMYYERCEAYLRRIKPQIEEGYRNGIALGFKNAHDFNVQNSTSDGTAARSLVELIDQKKMSGLKQDPIFFGRPFNTSEAIGRVIFEKWTGQLEAYQQCLTVFIEDLYLKILVLGGFPVKSLVVEFDKPNTKDKLRDAQARQLHIQNTILLRDENIISQAQAAKELNYDRAFKEAPVKTDPSKPDNGGGGNNKPKPVV